MCPLGIWKGNQEIWRKAQNKFWFVFLLYLRFVQDRKSTIWSQQTNLKIAVQIHQKALKKKSLKEEKIKKYNPSRGGYFPQKKTHPRSLTPGSLRVFI